MGHRTHQPPVLQDGTAAHPLHDAAGLRQQCRVGNAQHHIAARVGIVHLFNIDAVAAGRFAVGSGQYLCRAGQHLLRKGKLRLLPGNGGAYRAVDAVFAVDADSAKGVVADKFALQLPGAAGGAAGASHDLAGHDLAAAQGDLLAGVTVADGMSQPGKHPGLRVHKGQRTHPGGGIPHPHPCPPLGVLGIPHRQKGGLPLLALADVNHLHPRTGSGFQRGMDLLVGLGDGVPHADDPVAQPQPRLLCRVHRTCGGMHLGKAHDKRPL